MIVSRYSPQQTTNKGEIHLFYIVTSKTDESHKKGRERTDTPTAERQDTEKNRHAVPNVFIWSITALPVAEKTFHPIILLVRHLRHLSLTSFIVDDLREVNAERVISLDRKSYIMACKVVICIFSLFLFFFPRRTGGITEIMIPQKTLTTEIKSA